MAGKIILVRSCLVSDSSGDNNFEVINMNRLAPGNAQKHDQGKQRVIPKVDTHPGTGLEYLDGKVQEIDARVMLGEEE